MLKGFTLDSSDKVPSLIDAGLYSMLLSKETGIWNKYNKCDVTAPIDYTTTGYGVIKFQSGAISICGRILLIEENTTFNIPLTTTGTGSIGVKIDLSQPAGEQYNFYSKTNQNLVQQDLHINRTGVYEFEIFRYTSTGSIITLAKQDNLIESNITTIENVLNRIDNIVNGVEAVEKSNKTLQLLATSSGATFVEVKLGDKTLRLEW